MSSLVSISKIARTFGCTEAEARRHIAENARHLRRMADRARDRQKKTGKKYRGFDADYLEERAGAYERAQP